MPVALGGHGQLLGAALGQVERELHHALGAGAREHRLLDHELALGALEHRAAHRRVFALGVLAHDHEVDIACLAVGERARHAVEQARRAQVDVLVEFATELQQRAPQRDVVGHRVGPAHRAEQQRIHAGELGLPVVGHHLAMLRVIIAAGPVDMGRLETNAEAARDRIERPHPFGHHLAADAVAGNHRNPVDLLAHRQRLLVLVPGLPAAPGFESADRSARSCIASEHSIDSVRD